MKREKAIYIGTAIFILMAISLGIIMYMVTKPEVEIQNSQESSKTVTNEIGKTVEEQEIEKKEVITNKEKEATSTSTPTPTIKTKEKTQPQQIKEEKEEEIKQEITFIKPTDGEIICEFAKENLIYSETLKEWITHTGVDIKADKTSVIKSSASGIIKSIVNDPRYGLTVVIEHDDEYETVYSNLLTAEFVVVGEEVAQGQTIGTAGNTASFESNMESHLHFELLKNGEYLDPTIYF